MNDRELLEYAAKAAGYEILKDWEYDDAWGFKCKFSLPNEKYSADWWNPLLDDGDALRLAVKLKIDIYTDNGSVEVSWIDEEISERHDIELTCDADYEGWDTKYSTVRRAIVLAAAEIGKQLETQKA